MEWRHAFVVGACASLTFVQCKGDDEKTDDSTDPMGGQSGDRDTGDGDGDGDNPASGGQTMGGAGGQTSATDVSTGSAVVSSAYCSAATVSWTAATWPGESPTDLEYRVYYSTEDNLNTVEDAEANGTPAGPYEANLTSLRVQGLTPDTTYYFNVVVLAPNGDKEIYQTDSDVTDNPMEMIRDFGGNSFTPSQFTQLGNELYFVARTGTDGVELWRYNETDGERIVHDLYPGNDGSLGMVPFSSTPNFLHVHDGLLYFQANDADGSSDRELWSFDGSATPLVGTNLIERDIVVGADGSTPTFLTTFDGKLVFQGNDATSGRELLYLDGGSLNVIDHVADAEGLNPGFLTEYDGKLYFSGNDGSVGVELYSWDGTSPPGLVADIDPRTSECGTVCSSSPQKLTVYRDKLYFEAITPTGGNQLMVYDGDTVDVVNDMFNPDPGGFQEMFVAHDVLYIVADIDVEMRLYAYDETGAPSEVHDEGGDPLANAFALASHGDNLVFSAPDESIANTLWTYDGSNPPEIICQDNVSNPLNAGGMTEFEGALYFGARADQLWVLR